MNRDQKERLAKQANEASRLSRNPGPSLSADASQGQVEGWLQWCDPNGCHTYDMAIAQGEEMYADADAAWESVAVMLADS